MNRILAILDEVGLTDESLVTEGIFRMPFSELQSLLEALHETVDTATALQDTSISEHLGFDFLASSSIRGDSFCAVCASAKVHSLARYAALYCDRVLIPFPVAPLRSDVESARLAVAKRLRHVLQMRPVIEDGIVQLFAPPIYLCPNHAQEFQKSTAPIRKRAGKVYRELIEKFTVVYRSNEFNGRDVLEINGPEEYIEHGKMMYVLDDTPEWAPKRLHSIDVRRGKVLSRTAIHKSGYVQKFFDVLARDLIYHQLVGAQYNTRYLTDLPGEALFFAGSGAGDQRGSATAALCAQLTHTVPLLRDVPIQSVLRLRRQETDSFELYRRSLSEIVDSHVKPGRFVSEGEATEIYNDILRPRLLKLKIEAESKKRSAQIKAGLKVGVPTAIITLGLINGLLPTDVAQLLKITGAASLITQAADSVAELKRNATELRNHDLYFLLRLSQSRHWLKGTRTRSKL